jgi:hypothetical protein
VSDPHAHDAIACDAAYAALVDDYRAAEDERDRLRAAVAEVVFHIGPVMPADLPRDAASGDGIVPYEQVPRLVDQVVIERDRLRTTVGEQDYALTLAARREDRLRAVVDAFRQIVAEVQANYPEDVWLPDSTHPDARAAAGCRVACREILRRLDQLDRSPTMGGDDA